MAKYIQQFFKTQITSGSYSLIEQDTPIWKLTIHSLPGVKFGFKENATNIVMNQTGTFSMEWDEPTVLRLYCKVEDTPDGSTPSVINLSYPIIVDIVAENYNSEMGVNE